MVDYLETELAVERTLAQGRAAREANIALALQRSVHGLAATTCDLMRAPRPVALGFRWSCSPFYALPCSAPSTAWPPPPATSCVRRPRRG